jgi:hypothetical protein
LSAHYNYKLVVLIETTILSKNITKIIGVGNVAVGYVKITLGSNFAVVKQLVDFISIDFFKPISTKY